MKEKTFITIVAVIVIILGLVLLYYFKANLNGDRFNVPMPTSMR